MYALEETLEELVYTFLWAILFPYLADQVKRKNKIVERIFPWSPWYKLFKQFSQHSVSDP